VEDKVKVFASDDNLKTLGELLSNDSSRKIIYNLMNKKMYTNELATKLDMRVSLVIHHLKKLEELQMIEISEEKIKRKGVKHRFFKINSDIFVTINKDKVEIEEKGFLSRIFKEGVKFTSIGIASLVSYLLTQKQSSTNDDLYLASGDGSIDLTIPFFVLIIGLILEKVLSVIKKNKKGVILE